jgi:TRAP transporter TAXI family solute receptor
MKRSKMSLAGFVGSVVLAAAWITWLTVDEESEPQDLVISTATKGGTYIKLGKLLAPILEESGGAIGRVSSVPSDGSFHNIERLQSTGGNPCEASTPSTSSCRADLAFVVAPAAVGRPGVSVLMTLYADVLQLVVRRDERIEDLSDLRGRRIIVGNEGSFTRRISTGVLSAVDIGAGDYSPVSATGFQDASARLQLPSDDPDAADAAFFMAGTPVDVHESGRLQGLEPRTIPPLLYESQPSGVQTLQARALLVAREDLSPHVVRAILSVIFDRIGELAVANIRANEIKLWNAFDPPGSGLELHPEAKRFEEMEKHTLLIATGSLRGKYHQVGKMIQLLLQQRRIRTLAGALTVFWEEVRADPWDGRRLLAVGRSRARVVHTDGSMENARLLGRRPTLAIMQYDTALASRVDQSSIYRTELPNIDFSDLPNLKRIATLHPETLYVIARREELPKQAATLGDLAGKRVCLGPEHSGTRVIAEAVLAHHGISTSVKASYLMVPDMVQRLHSGEIDAGFFVSGLPSHAVQTLLEDPDLRLLSLGSKERAQIVESAPFYAKSIPAGTYACQQESEPDIQTIATRAVLVANGDLPFDVETITQAIFEGAAFLDVGGSALDVGPSSIAAAEDPRQRLQRFMAQDLPSLPLHEDARAYYEKVDLRPRRPTLVDFLYDWLTATWRMLTVLLILVTGYAGFIRLKRDRKSNQIGRRIFKIVMESQGPEWKLRKLLEQRDDIKKRVPMRYWQLEELDKPRWHELNELIEYWRRVIEGKLTRDLADEIDDGNANLNDAQRLDRRKQLLYRVRKHFEADELEAEQYELLTKLIDEELPEPVSAEIS